jgi:hypothetical protein
MIRHAAAAVLLACLMPATLQAQGTTITVNQASASVYRTPSTGGVVIGEVQRGAVLPVTRELGSWVKVSWPDAPDGVGYLHVTMGRIGNGSAAGAVAASEPVQSPERAAVMTAVAADVRRVEQAALARETAPRTETGVAPVSHFLGMGGRMGAVMVGSPLGFGVSARGWRRRVGLQLEVSRYSLTSSLATEQMTSLHVEPSLLFALPDRVSDYVWLRPYVGSGATFARRSISGISAPVTAEGASDGAFGVRAFGGGEVMFAALPQLALSADVGYRWIEKPAVGLDDLGGISIGLSAHWYLK